MAAVRTGDGSAADVDRNVSDHAAGIQSRATFRRRDAGTAAADAANARLDAAERRPMAESLYRHLLRHSGGA